MPGHRTRKAITQGRFLLASAFVAFGLTGCLWDSTLFDDLDVGERCEGFRFVYSSDGCLCERGYNCECKDIPSLDEAFKSGWCPRGFRCAYNETEKQNECVQGCTSDQVRCAGRCISPDTDQNFCGATGNCEGENAGQACGDGETCEDRECIPSCLRGQVLCEDDKGIRKCITPGNDPEFCGAVGDCQGDNAGMACTGGQTCQNYECKCPAGQVYCDGNCINPLNDRDYCGAVDDCSRHNAGEICRSGYSCQEGKCLLGCAGGQVLCEEAGTEKCISPGTDMQFCGAKEDCKGDNRGKPCSPDEKCNNEENAQCEPFCGIGNNFCFFNGSCVNNDTYCGNECTNCNTAGNAASGTCSNGSCIITSCARGNYLADGKCHEFAPEACGAVPEDCTKREGWKEATCSLDGDCIVMGCKVGYHLTSGDCKKDTVTECGERVINCTGQPGWEEGDCDGGRCVASECQTGFCLNDNTCAAGTNTPATCGIVGHETCVNCRIDPDGNTACSGGQCVPNPCVDGDGKPLNVCYQGETDECRNTNDLCGQGCLDCSSIEGTETSYCTVDGNCIAVKCSANYHLDNKGNCVADRPDCCGYGCIDCSGSPNGPVCVSGTCGCPSGQVYCGDDCIDPQTSSTNCGARLGGTCSSTTTTSNNYQGANCTGGRICVGGSCACQTGQILCGGNCINPQTSNTNCGAKGSCNNTSSSNANYQGASCTGGQTCMSGSCACSEGISCVSGQQCSSGACVCMTSSAGCSGGVNNTCTNASHCGRCGNACTGNRICSGGECVCPSGWILCGSNCVDPQTSRTNCGAKGTCSGTDPRNANYQGANCGTSGNNSCSSGICRCNNSTCRLGERCNDSNSCRCGTSSNSCNSSQICVANSCVVP